MHVSNVRGTLAGAGLAGFLGWAGGCWCINYILHSLVHALFFSWADFSSYEIFQAQLSQKLFFFSVRTNTKRIKISSLALSTTFSSSNVRNPKPSKFLVQPFRQFSVFPVDPLIAKTLTYGITATKNVNRIF